MIKILFITTFVIYAFTQNAYAQVVINEIMYDVAGGDDGHEWIEVKNTGTTAIDLSLYRFFEAGVHHKLSAVLGTTLSSGGYAVIADDAVKFQIDFPSFSGVLYDSSFSLSNVGETLSIKLDDSVIDSVSYVPSELANGTGATLQKVGSSFVSLAATPGASSDAGNPVVNEPPGTEDPNTPSNQSSQNSSSGSGGTVADPDPTRIVPDAGADQTVIAGAPVLMSGKASIGGKPVSDTARFLWNFGDGATFIGRTTNHVYRSPGRYVVSLSVSSGETSATDMLTITVVESPISIASTVPGPEGYVSLFNASKGVVDISTWYLQVKEQIFVFPPGTFIAGSSVVRFDAAITRLSFASPQEVFLRFPNGKEASVGIQDVVTPKAAVSVQATPKPHVDQSKMTTAPEKGLSKSLVVEAVPETRKEEDVTDKLLQGALVEETIDQGQTQKSGMFWWYGALVLVLALGTVGVILIEKKKPVDEFEIIEADE